MSSFADLARAKSPKKGSITGAFSNESGPLRFAITRQARVIAEERDVKLDPECFGFRVKGGWIP